MHYDPQNVDICTKEPVLHKWEKFWNRTKVLHCPLLLFLLIFHESSLSKRIYCACFISLSVVIVCIPVLSYVIWVLLFIAFFKRVSPKTIFFHIKWVNYVKSQIKIAANKWLTFIQFYSHRYRSWPHNPTVWLIY